jgi:hypothetical protein
MVATGARPRRAGQREMYPWISRQDGTLTIDAILQTNQPFAKHAFKEGSWKMVKCLSYRLQRVICKQKALAEDLLESFFVKIPLFLFSADRIPISPGLGQLNHILFQMTHLVIELWPGQIMSIGLQSLANLRVWFPRNIRIPRSVMWYEIATCDVQLPQTIHRRWEFSSQVPYCHTHVLRISLLGHFQHKTIELSIRPKR